MHPRITEVLDHFDAQRRELRDALDSVPMDQRQIQPDANSWSVLGVVEHIAAVEVAVAGLLKRRIAEGRDAGVGAETETSSVVSPAYVGKILDRTQRIVTSESLYPKAKLDSAEAWRAVEAAREALRAVVIDADGLALGQISAPHRVFGNLNVYEWIIFLGSHESRHAAQIREIAGSLKHGRA